MKSIAAAVSLTSLLIGSLAQSLPQVDLGYEIHQALSFNNVSQTYNFMNIRYAQPPIGELRFAAPVPPTGRNPVVQNGSFSPTCPQASPGWSPVGNLFVAAFEQGKEASFNYSAAVASVQAANANAPPYQPSPQETEDCLFLDVVVPKSIFDSAGQMRRRQTGACGAPVLLWIYGGGYTEGDKNEGGFYNPAGLIRASQANGGQGIIYVAINYRLGALGWLAGPTFQSEGGVSNAALYDQRLAIEWVKNNIHLFGGDPNQITLVGESAGGGSIVHQITAFGGLEGVSFQRAVPQSAAWTPINSLEIQENDTMNFFKNLNVSSLAEARAASSAQVVTANLLTVYAAPYGQYVFGPVVDGVFVPAQPAQLLLNNMSYAKNISVMPGHNTNEGPYFTAPYVQTDDQLQAFFKGNFPAVTQPILDYITGTLYPAVYDGSHGYTSPVDRTITLITEQIFTCNTDYLAKAYQNQTYNYQFAVPPAVHGQDVYSTFYQGQGTNLSQGIYGPVADAMQTFITNFVMTGNPNSPALMSASGPLPYFPMQQNNATEMLLNYTVTSPTTIAPAIGVATDPTVNARCAWWQLGLYL